MRGVVPLLACLLLTTDASRRRRARRMYADDELSPEIDLDAPEPTEILALPGRKFPLNFAAGEFTIKVRRRRRAAGVLGALVATAPMPAGWVCRANPSC